MPVPSVAILMPSFPLINMPGTPRTVERTGLILRVFGISQGSKGMCGSLSVSVGCGEKETRFSGLRCQPAWPAVTETGPGILLSHRPSTPPPGPKRKAGISENTIPCKEPLPGDRIWSIVQQPWVHWHNYSIDFKLPDFFRSHGAYRTP